MSRKPTRAARAGQDYDVDDWAADLVLDLCRALVWGVVTLPWIVIQLLVADRERPKKRPASPSS